MIIVISSSSSQMISYIIIICCYFNDFKGLRSQDPNLEAIWHAAGSMPQSPAGPLTEADLKASRSSWPIVMFLAVVFGGPYLIWRLLSSLAPTVKSKTKAWVTGEGEHYAAVGVYNFQVTCERNGLHT